MSESLAVKFSNDEYLTKRQVSSRLKTTLIDKIWMDILNYRKGFSTDLALRSFEKARLIYVITPKMGEKINQTERRLNKLAKRIDDLKKKGDAFSIFKNRQTTIILSNIAALYSINTDDAFYKRLFSGNTSTTDVDATVILNYYFALKNILEDEQGPLDENLIASISEIYNGKPVNNYLYRTIDIAQRNVIIDALLTAAPVNRVSDAMDDLFTFIQSSNAPIFVKFAAILYYFTYIRPFEYYSEEIALLFAKAYLKRQDLDEVAIYLNLEVILVELRENLNTVSEEVRKTVDLTYIVDFLADLFQNQINQFEESIFNAEKEQLNNERYALETPKDEQQTVEEIKVQEPVSETEVETTDSSQPLISEVETSKVETNNQQVTESYNVPKYVNPTQRTIEGPVRTVVDTVVTEITVGLSEEDAQILEKHYRESDPSLSRNEAYFYARHCTRGKYYTISQFKEVTKCAYETARTSMDHLASSGYYRKEQFKNKFIYTPLGK